MKRLIFPFLILSLILAACGTAKTTDNSSANGSDRAARTLPPTMQLAIGTFRLEGSDQAVTAEEAKELLPLWQVYGSLTQSDTAAQAEIDALVKQIQDSMSTDQMQAIQDMNLTQDDVFALMQEQGISMGGGPQASGTQTSGSSGFVPGGPEGMPGGAGMPQGGPPPDGGGGLPGGGSGAGGASGNQGSGAVGTPQPRAGMDRIPTALLDALTNLLKERAAS